MDSHEIGLIRFQLDKPCEDSNYTPPLENDKNIIWCHANE
jgi:hypothetical protein